MVQDKQTHLIPGDPDDLRATALRMNYEDHDRGAASVRLLKEYTGHTERVHTIFQRVFYAK
jgi:glutamine synthetase adenylyltransferase